MAALFHPELLKQEVCGWNPVGAHVEPLKLPRDLHPQGWELQGRCPSGSILAHPNFIDTVC